MTKIFKLSSFVLIAFSMALASCSNGSEKEKQKESAVASVEKSEVQKITLEEFTADVWDFKNSPESFILKNDLPVVVDFYADWCRPCKITSPILDELSKEYAGKVQFYKVNTDEQRELASAFGIRSIPSFLWAPKEGKPQMTSGIAQTEEATKEMFRKQIDEFLLNNTK